MSWEGATAYRLLSSAGRHVKSPSPFPSNLTTEQPSSSNQCWVQVSTLIARVFLACASMPLMCPDWPRLLPPAVLDASQARLARQHRRCEQALSVSEERVTWIRVADGISRCHAETLVAST